MVCSTSGIYSSPICEVMTCLCFWNYVVSLFVCWFLVWNQIKCSNWNNISFLWLMPQQSHLIYHVLNCFFTTANKAYDVSSCWWLKSCTTWDVWNPINNGKNYQPQLVSRISAINSLIFVYTVFSVCCQDPLSIIMDHCRGAFRCISIAVELDQWSVENFMASQPTPQKRSSARNRAFING